MKKWVNQQKSVEIDELIWGSGSEEKLLGNSEEDGIFFYTFHLIIYSRIVYVASIVVRCGDEEN